MKYPVSTAGIPQKPPFYAKRLITLLKMLKTAVFLPLYHRKTGVFNNWIVEKVEKCS